MQTDLGGHGVLAEPCDVVVAGRTRTPQLAIQIAWHPRGEDHGGFVLDAMRALLKMGLARAHQSAEQCGVVLAAPGRFWRWLPGYAAPAGLDVLDPDRDAGERDPEFWPDRRDPGLTGTRRRVGSPVVRCDRVRPVASRGSTSRCTCSSEGSLVLLRDHSTLLPSSGSKGSRVAIVDARGVRRDAPPMGGVDASRAGGHLTW